MIETRHYGAARLYLCRLPEAATRREAEKAAVEALLRHAFPEGAVLCHTPEGAPYLKDNPVHISISHSRSRAALAVCAEAPVGVDVETLRDQLARVAPRVLSEAELADYGTTAEGLLRAWTLKEALYKAAGVPGVDFRTGINLPVAAAGHKKNEATVATPGGAAKRFAILAADAEGGEGVAFVVEWALSP